MKICDGCERIEEPPRGRPATPALASLRLDDQAMASLAQQGFVRTEWRGQRGPYYRLRFRVGRRQQSRYLGQDATFADQVRTELAELQAPRRLDLELHHVSRRARQFLRQSKLDLQDGVQAHRGSYHGLHIRLPASIPKPAPRSAVTAVNSPFDEVEGMSDTNENRNDDNAVNQPTWPGVPPSKITPAAPSHGKPLETEMTQNAFSHGSVPHAGNRFAQQLETVLDESSELSSLLAQRIKKAMHTNCSEVKDFGRLPQAYDSYSGLLRQFGSLGQLKRQLDRQSEN